MKLVNTHIEIVEHISQKTGKPYKCLELVSKDVKTGLEANRKRVFLDSDSDFKLLEIYG